MAKFLKGSTTIRELEDMPARMIHLIYSEYIKVQLDESKKKASEEEAAAEEMIDAVT